MTMTGTASRMSQRNLVPIAVFAGICALIVLAVQAWDAADADRGRDTLGAPSSATGAPEKTGRYAPSEVGEGQAPPASSSEVAELASPSASMFGTRPVLVGYRAEAGDLCLGWVRSANTGLPSACDPRPETRDRGKLYVYQWAADAPKQGQASARAVYGSAPARTAYVEVVLDQQTVQVPASTSDASQFADSTFFAVIVPGRETQVQSVIAYASNGEKITSYQP